MLRGVCYILFCCGVLWGALCEPQMNPPNDQARGPHMRVSQGGPSGDPANPVDDNLSPNTFFKMFGDEKGLADLKMDTGPHGPGGPNGDLGFEHFDISVLQTMARQQSLQENLALKPPVNIETTQNRDDKNPDAHRHEELIIYGLCFCLSYIWRRGRQSVRLYYHLRDIYVNHIEYDVGYITHAIMIKYQNVLELYQYVSKLVSESTAKSLKINPVHMTHFYSSMREDVRTIQYLCDMMHELKAKYKKRGYSVYNRFAIPEETTPEERLRIGRQNEENNLGEIDKSYLEKRLEQSHKLINDALAQRKKKLEEAQDHYKKNPYQSTKRTQPTMRLWSPNLDYDLSGDDDDW